MVKGYAKTVEGKQIADTSAGRMSEEETEECARMNQMSQTQNSTLHYFCKNPKKRKGRDNVTCPEQVF